MNGKGSVRRPMQISPEEFARRWAVAFGNKAKKVRTKKTRTGKRSGNGGV